MPVHPTPEIYARPITDFPPSASSTAAHEQGVLVSIRREYARRGWSASVSIVDGWVRVVAVPQAETEPFDYLLGLCQQGDIEDALACLGVLNSITDDADTAYNYGVALAELGRVEESLAPLAKCLEIDPAYDQAAIALGLSLTRLERHEEAETVLRAAAKLRPDNALLKFNLATTLASTGKAIEALPFFRQASTLAPNNASVLMGLARCLDELEIEHQAEMCRVCRSVVKKFPDTELAQAAMRLLNRQARDGLRSLEGEYLPAEMPEKFRRQQQRSTPPRARLRSSD